MGTLIEAHAERLARDGYTILDGAFDSDFADAPRTDAERLERELADEPARSLFEGARTRRVYNLLARGTSFEPAVDHERVRG